jgi:hypothetical protein
MKRLFKLLAIACGFHLIMAQPAFAGFCDYRPSGLIGGTKTAAISGGVAGTAVVGVGMKAAGLYAITNATTGAVMLGSTTTGIIASTAGVAGTVGAFLLSPFVIIPAAITAAGVGLYEGGCYLSQ